MLGRHIPETNGKAAGYLDTTAFYQMSHKAGRAMELSGWAEHDGAAAECIAIIDRDRTVIGTGASITRRSDVERAKHRSLGLVGWTAVAPIPQRLPVCALALFSAENQWIPLSNCSSSVNSTVIINGDQ